MSTENPINASQAAELLGMGKTTVSALKASMGIKGRRFFLSDMKRFIRENPGWRVQDVYPRELKSITLRVSWSGRRFKVAVSQHPELVRDSVAKEQVPEAVGQLLGEFMSARQRSRRDLQPSTSDKSGEPSC